MNDITIKNRLETTIPLGVYGKQPVPSQGASFGSMLSEAIDGTDRLRKTADTAISDFASGKETDIHKTMIAMEKASISFKLMMQVRNKVIAAYQEIMRTQV
ncbi:MAG: flagellar hook-basal body complex protein FliE [Deltaproteobacteria bacterium]|nr:flagellar hook-basal body complex protein FliE [Deltaproteobacteria bacterium]